jgi:hypothetical protein
VTTKIPTTIEAAALCKMADRGQITGAILDGPLAFDNAVDVERPGSRGSNQRSQAGRRFTFVAHAINDNRAGAIWALTPLGGALVAAIAVGFVSAAVAPIVKVTALLTDVACRRDFARAKQRLRGSFGIGPGL